MSVTSYMAFPRPGRLEEMVDELSGIPGCEVVPAERGELAMVITETTSRSEERSIDRRIRRVSSLACLACLGPGRPNGA